MLYRALALLAAMPVIAPAATLFVDASNPNCPGTGTAIDPYCQIQNAIAAAIPGDSIQVAPGTYVENLDFLGKDIVVQSTGGPAVTIIDGNKAGSCVRFVNGESAQAELRGFRIVNGGGTPGGLSNQRNGGGVYTLGASPTIRGNEFANQTPFASPGTTLVLGACIYAEGGAPLIADNEFRDSFSSHGTAIYAILCPGITITGNSLHDLEAEGNAGVHVQACNGAILTDNSFLLCGAPGAFGPPGTSGPAALEMSQCQQVSVVRNSFVDCHCEEEAVVLIYQSSGEISDNRMEDCSASIGAGGFLLLDCASVLFARNELRSNSGSAGSTGGTEIRQSSGILVEGCLFHATATQGMAFKTTASSDIQVRRSDFTQNLPYIGVFVASGAATFEDCRFTDNGYGLIALANATVRRCTFTGNTTRAISADLAAANVSLESSILYQNGAAEIAGPGTVTVSDSLVFGGFPGTNVINANPMFVDPANGLYQLQAGSPCIDTGAATDNTCGLDIEGLPRRVSGLFTTTARVDMGAHEFSNVRLLVTDLGGGSYSVASTGATGQPTLLLVSTAPAQSCLPPAGTLLVDLAAPSLVLSWLPLPSLVTLNVPPSAPGLVWIQQLVLGPTLGTANLSGVQVVEI